VSGAAAGAKNTIAFVMQDLVAILIALAAAAFLARRAWQRLASRRAGACGACAGCSSRSQSRYPLVSISLNPSHANPQTRQEVRSHR
jgi:hypothetical protein